MCNAVVKNTVSAVLLCNSLWLPDVDLKQIMFSLFLQSDSSSAATPSSRSQKIAQAKWEFLFGGKKEETRCSKGTAGNIMTAIPQERFEGIQTSTRIKGQSSLRPHKTHFGPLLNNFYNNYNKITLKNIQQDKMMTWWYFLSKSKEVLWLLFTPQFRNSRSNNCDSWFLNHV